MVFGFCQYDVIATSIFVIVSIKLSLDVANDEYIFLNNFGGHNGVLSPPPLFVTLFRSQEAKKKGLNRIKDQAHVSLFFVLVNNYMSFINTEIKNRIKNLLHLNCL